MLHSVVPAFAQAHMDGSYGLNAQGHEIIKGLDS